MTPGILIAKADMPDQGSKQRASFYRPELDVLRFLAFLMVFMHHCPFPASHAMLRNISGAGGYGVCIFFMLSAYLIAELLMKERERTGSVHIKSFFIRRALRIWPLYFLALALGIIAGEFVPAFHVSMRALPYLLLIAGNFFVAHAGWQLGVIGPLWSLSVEEQFYLLIPTVMKLGGKRALKFAAWMCFPPAYLALIWLGLKHAVPQTGVWVNSFVQFQFFAAGTLLALALHNKDWVLSLMKRILLGTAGLFGFVLTEMLFHLQTDRAAPPWQLCAGYLIVLVSCIGIFLAIFKISLKAPRSLIYLGRVSFGLYVFHEFVLRSVFYTFANIQYRNYVHRHSFFFAFLSLAVTIGMASASFHLFEKRILRIKERFAYVKSGA